MSLKTPSGSPKCEQRSIAVVPGGETSAFKSVHYRRSVAVAHAPFPSAWVAFNDQHLEHQKNTPAIAMIKLTNPANQSASASIVV